MYHQERGNGNGSEKSSKIQLFTYWLKLLTFWVQKMGSKFFYTKKRMRERESYKEILKLLFGGCSFLMNELAMKGVTWADPSIYVNPS